MSTADSFVLRFVFVPTIDADMRTFKVHLLSDGSPQTTELYRVRSFFLFHMLSNNLIHVVELVSFTIQLQALAMD